MGMHYDCPIQISGGICECSCDACSDDGWIAECICQELVDELKKKENK